MLNAYEVTVTYKLYALDENDATSQVLANRVEPDAIDVLDLPTSSTPQIDIVNF